MTASDTLRRVNVTGEAIAAFCRRHRIRRLALFGSVLRADFRPGSDVDVLVEFADDAHVSLFDLAEMQGELQAMLGRPVDLVEKDGLRNPFRRRAILKRLDVVYEA